MREKPVCVTLGWDGLPTLQFSDGTIFSKDVELILYSEYYPDG